VVPGTFKYWAPELITALRHGDRLYGRNVDIYSYGIIMCQLIEREREPRLAGSPRNRADSPLLWGNAILAGQRPATTKANPQQVAWLNRLWSQLPGDRPSFVQICAEWERGVHLFPGTDRARFDQYKQWVDSEERNLAVIAPSEDAPAPPWALDINKRTPLTQRIARDIVTSATDGDREAQKCAAILFLTGTGVEQSFLMAAKFATMTEDPLMVILSRVSRNVGEFQRGELFEANGKVREASECYKKAAEGGSYRALWRWGFLLVHNDVGGHINAGLKMLETAAENKIADAAFELGKLYVEGVAVIQDEPRGIKWMQKALELKHPDAAFYLGRYHHSRFDMETARKYYELADKVTEEEPPKDDQGDPVGHWEAHGLARAVDSWCPKGV
jgi:tetratricopeptide (TPR) repeat protein